MTREPGNGSERENTRERLRMFKHHATLERLVREHRWSVANRVWLRERERLTSDGIPPVQAVDLAWERVADEFAPLEPAEWARQMKHFPPAVIPESLHARFHPAWIAHHVLRAFVYEDAKLPSDQVRRLLAAQEARLHAEEEISPLEPIQPGPEAEQLVEWAFELTGGALDVLALAVQVFEAARRRIPNTPGAAQATRRELRLLIVEAALIPLALANRDRDG